MSLSNVKMHESFVPAYQLSAIPHVTSSQINQGEIHEHSFEFVTRFFNVKNRGLVSSDSICVSFTLNGFNTGNFFTLDQGDSFRDEIRTTKIFISGSSGSSIDYEIVAGLTMVPNYNFLILSSSNGYNGVG